jgi:hypothetical protein
MHGNNGISIANRTFPNIVNRNIIFSVIQNKSCHELENFFIVLDAISDSFTVYKLHYLCLMIYKMASHS